MPGRHLTEQYRITASGARTVEPFEVGGRSLVAIPQLSRDIPGEPANMNGGNADTTLLVLQRGDDGCTPFQELPVPGGEDAEFFRIGDRAFLAAASVRTGSGPYDYAATSQVFEWRSGEFAPFQSFPTFAAKQWRHFTVGDEHFLALAQGIEIPGQENANRDSEIFRWDGSSFVPFQTIPSRWAYNWHTFRIDGEHYLAHADHVVPSVLYRWDNRKFTAHQQLVPEQGRAFADFAVDGERFLLVACLQSPSRLLRWTGSAFEDYQVLDGLGGREFAVIESDELYVIRVNFILGTRAEPQPAINSQVYQWQHGKLEIVEEFPTTGAADVSIHRTGGETLVFVANALDAQARFAATPVVYRFQ